LLIETTFSSLIFNEFNFYLRKYWRVMAFIDNGLEMKEKVQSINQGLIGE